MTTNKVASDNDNHIYLTTTNGIIALDSKGKRIWSVELGGKLKSDILVKKDTLVAIESFEDKNISLLKEIRLSNGTIQDVFIIKSADRIITLDNHKEGYILGYDNSITETDGKKNTIQDMFIDARITTNILYINKSILFGSSNRTLLNVSNSSKKILAQINLKDIPSGTIIKSNKYLYIGDTLGNVYSIDIDTNKVFWTVKTGGKIVDIDQWNKYLLVSSNDNFVYLLSKKNGNKIWKRRLAGRVLGKEFLSDNYAILLAQGTNIALIIDYKNGNIKNKLSISNNSSFISKPILVNNQIILPTRKGISAYSYLCNEKRVN